MAAVSAEVQIQEKQVMRTIRIAGGVCAVMLLLELGACGGAGGSTDSASNPTAFNPTDTTAPTVSITSPTASGNYATASATVGLSGSTSDNVGVASVTWRNAANGANGNASGTSSWNIAGIALALGMNAIAITAHDAAGNTREATLAVTYNPGGGTSLSGSVDSSLINRNGMNAVYVYNGTVVPDDVGSGTPPVTTAPVTQDNNACTFSYQLGGLAAGTYTVAFTNQAANDTTANEAIAFLGTAQVTVGAGGGAIHDFLPTRRLQVGPTRTLKVPSAAAAVALDGDVIEIDAGEYLDDIVVWRRNNLTLRGVGGGRAHQRATRIIPFDGTDQGNGKGIWVTPGRNIAVENIEFSGASVPDQNGAGIRADGPDLTVCNGYFHDNENGILDGSGIVTIEYSEFNHNGFGDGFTHNMYISAAVTRFTLRYSYSHHASIGHNVKSRAQENHILYNRIMDEQTGTSSYSIDLPNTGRSFIIGNLIQQGPNTDNSAIVAYGAENGNNPVHELYVVNNTIVNDDPAGGQFLTIRGGTTARLVNNIFAGPGSVPSGAGITSTNNLVSNTPGLVNRATFDYRLTAGSPAINMGTDPGIGAGVSLVPISQYLHPANRQDRPIAGTIDIGAYEFK
jgi:hypothetical protein